MPSEKKKKDEGEEGNANDGGAVLFLSVSLFILPCRFPLLSLSLSTTPLGFSFPFPLLFMVPFVSSCVHVRVSYLFFLPPVSAALSPPTCNFPVLLPLHSSCGWTVTLAASSPHFQPPPLLPQPSCPPITFISKSLWTVLNAKDSEKQFS